MSTEVRLPDVGENVETGQVVKVLVSVGDEIEPGQSLLELETDKAVIEVPSTVSGRITDIHVKEGQEIKVGELILSVEPTSAKEGLSAQEASLEPEPEPQTLEKHAEEVFPKQEEVDEAKPKEVRRDGREVEAEVDEVRAPDLERPPQTIQRLAPAAPSVRRLARELGVDINQVPGSGPGGRISPEDVKNYVRGLSLDTDRTRPAVTEVPTSSLPDFTKWGQVEREAMSNIRRTTARRLSQAWTTIPHVTHFDMADTTDLEELRNHYAKRAESLGGKLTITAIILKVVASALKIFPKFNASLDMANQEIVYKRYYNIGVAVDTEQGLLVPVIRDVDQKNILELSVELTAISEKARNRKITLEDLEGGTFTITNLGGIGGVNFAPIINPPDVAILGIARASTEAVFKDGGFEPRLRLPLSLSYDHRLIDGADAARFMRWIVQALEQPFLMSLEG